MYNEDVTNDYTESGENDINPNNVTDSDKTNASNAESFSNTTIIEDFNLRTTSGVIETSSISLIQNSTTISNPDSLSENPQFLECITSCGTDHDCVRTKCLLDSTYFG